MFLASFLIGLREGLEGALIVGILVAFVVKRDRRDVLRKIWLGVGLAIAGSLAIAALLKFGSYGLSFEGQELIGGSLSLVAVAMVTYVVFWSAKAGRTMKSDLESSAGDALALGTGWGMFWLAFLSVGREGLETSLLLWGWAMQPLALVGALVGLIVAAGLGYLIYRGMIRINFSTFFAWMGAFLIVVAGGILAYGIHDLQEARFLPGPFSGAPITPTDFRTGDVLVGFFTDRPFWGAAYPFGYAFDLQDVIDPSGAAAALLKGTVGFTPLMTWLEVTAWVVFMAIVVPLFVRQVRAQAKGRRAAEAARAVAARAATSPGATSPTATPPADPSGADRIPVHPSVPSKETRP